MAEVWDGWKAQRFRRSPLPHLGQHGALEWLSDRKRGSRANAGMGAASCLPLGQIRSMFSPQHSPGRDSDSAKLVMTLVSMDRSLTHGVADSGGGERREGGRER